MKKIYRIIFAIAFPIAFPLILNNFLHQKLDPANQHISPIQKQVGKLNVSIDPRIELLSAIQASSDYEIIRRNNFYYNHIETYFTPFTHLQAISSTNKLARIGFSYDAPVQFMLYLTQPNECKPYLSYSDYLINRAQGEQQLIDYQNDIREFAVESKFHFFWKKNESFYEKIVHLSASELDGTDWISALEGYFNNSYNSYNIIVSPLSKGGYGFFIPTEKGGKDIYAILPPSWNGKGNIPYLDKSSLMFYIWHEFGHSFVNPEVEKHAEVIANTSKLFNPIQDRMTKQAYNNWAICVNEHIVRAINIRLTEMYIGKEEAEQKLKYELSQNFVYIEPVLEKLKEYEYVRENKGITFSDFVPTLLNVLDSISKTDYKVTLPEDIPFEGPINNAFQADNIAVIYPTNNRENESIEDTKSYVEEIHHRFFKKGLLIPDTIATKIDLSAYGLVVYGTIENNLFLQKYKSQFPFKIEDNTITADRQYTESNIKLITCLPNPQNQKLGMVIYAAMKNKDIADINNVFHGPEDYILFIDKDHVLKKGFYKKTDEWAF